MSAASEVSVTSVTDFIYLILGKETVHEQIVPFLAIFFSLYSIKKVFSGTTTRVVFALVQVPIILATLIQNCINQSNAGGVNLYREIDLPRYHTPLDLKRKSKQIFKQFHPDKQTLVEDKEIAGQIFAKKTGIVNFFSDINRKNIYDRFDKNLSNDTRDIDLIQEFEKNMTLNYIVEDMFAAMAVPVLVVMPFVFKNPARLQSAVRLLTFNLIFKVYYSALKNTSSAEILDFFYPFETLFVKGKIWNIIWASILAIFLFLDDFQAQKETLIEVEGLGNSNSEQKVKSQLLELGIIIKQKSEQKTRDIDDLTSSSEN